MAVTPGRYYPVLVIENVGASWVSAAVDGIPRSGVIHRVSATCSTDVAAGGDVRADDGPAGIFTDVACRLSEVESSTGYGSNLTGGRIVAQYALTPAAPAQTIDSLEQPPLGYLGEVVTGAPAGRNGRIWVAVKLGPDPGDPDLAGTVVVRLEIGDD